jgi:hypothetical protein
MTTKSAIAWTRTMRPDGSVLEGTTWSPVTGCTKLSAGCKHCYAEREAETRWSKNPRSVFFGRPFSDVRCHHEQLRQVIVWGKGRRPRKLYGGHVDCQATGILQVTGNSMVVSGFASFAAIGLIVSTCGTGPRAAHLLGNPGTRAAIGRFRPSDRVFCTGFCTDSGDNLGAPRRMLTTARTHDCVG